jgi:multiple sugar transport system permease protein
VRRPILSRRAGLLFLGPGLLLIVVFLVVPSLWVIGISLTNQALLGENAAAPAFVGLSNFASLFDIRGWGFPGQFGWSLRLSSLFVAGSVVGQAALGLAIAWLFHRRRGVLRELLYALVIVAWITPDVVVAFAWIAFLDRDAGTLNALLAALHLPRVDWLIGHPLLSIVLFNVWRGTAFSLLLFSGALATIPASYLETASVVGASAWQAFRDVVLPLIRRHIVTDLLLITLWTFNTFTPYLITAGGPAFHSELVPIYVWRTAFQYYDLGRGAAVAVVMLGVNLGLALFYLAGVRRQAARP